MADYDLVAVVHGRASGPALILAEPLSFWGGVDPSTGLIIERRHPQFGESIAGTVLFLPRGRGSSSASSVLAEAVRLHTAPAALVLREPDEILALGALVGEELYGQTTPVLVGSVRPTARTVVSIDGPKLRFDAVADPGPRGG